ncbi:MAG: thiamine ABC transporter ATP-binding protein [Inquilinus sp.]|nr:thiamine ABC transporter ATP-binding protein [Inquilinus sp.]
MIELRDAVYRYDHAEMRFELSVAAGAFVAVIGPSGAGKTTLLNLIAGFERPESGKILLDGREATALAPAARPVTTLFQEHNLFAHLTAAQNVGLGLHPGLRLSPAQHAEVAAALAIVGLAGLGGRLPRQLSGGERQRVALARSVVRDRKVLLLDEPFAALDPALREEMVALVDRLRRERGLTVLLVTHLLDEVGDFADRAIFVCDGRILADGVPADLLNRPTVPELKAYLGRRAAGVD